LLSWCYLRFCLILADFTLFSLSLDTTLTLLPSESIPDHSLFLGIGKIGGIVIDRRVKSYDVIKPQILIKLIFYELFIFWSVIFVVGLKLVFLELCQIIRNCVVAVRHLNFLLLSLFLLLGEGRHRHHFVLAVWVYVSVEDCETVYVAD
jgi:hypothetical protein